MEFKLPLITDHLPKGRGRGRDQALRKQQMLRSEAEMAVLIKKQAD